MQATRTPSWGFSSFTGQNKHNKPQKIQYMLHEILAFSSREPLFNRLPALFFMTASVSFYQAFFPATYRAFCVALLSWIWFSLAQLKQKIMKRRCWQASKGLRLSMSSELMGYGSIISIPKHLLVAWNHTGVTWIRISAPDQRDSQNLGGIRDALLLPSILQAVPGFPQGAESKGNALQMVPDGCQPNSSFYCPRQPLSFCLLVKLAEHPTRAIYQLERCVFPVPVSVLSLLILLT